MRLDRLAEDRDVRAIARRAQRDRKADAARSAGDEQRATGEPSHRRQSGWKWGGRLARNAVDAFGEMRRRRASREALRLGVQLLGQRALHRIAQQPLEVAHGERGRCREAPREHRRRQRRARHAATTRLTRPRRCASSRAEALAEHQDLGRLARADDARQPVRAAAVGRHADAADRPTRSRRRRLANARSQAFASESPNPATAPCRRPITGCGMRASVSTARARARSAARTTRRRDASSSRSDSPKTRMSPPAMKCVPAPRSTMTTRSASSAASSAVRRDQCIDQREVECVERRRPVQRQRGDRAVAVEEDRVVHGGRCASRQAAREHPIESSTGSSPKRRSAGAHRREVDVDDVVDVLGVAAGHRDRDRDADASAAYRARSGRARQVRAWSARGGRGDRRRTGRRRPGRSRGRPRCARSRAAARRAASRGRPRRAVPSSSSTSRSARCLAKRKVVAPVHRKREDARRRPARIAAVPSPWCTSRSTIEHAAARGLRPAARGPRPPRR